MTPSEMISQADSLFKARSYDDSRVLYISAVAEAEKIGSISDLTEALAMVARAYLITDRKEEGRPWLAKAQSSANASEPLGWSRYLGVRGRFEWQDKKLDTATATFKEMYRYCSEHKLHERAIDAAHMVAITGDYDSQIEWGLKGVAEAEAGKVTGWLGPLWNNLGATYEEMGKLRESLDAYIKAREYHWKYGDEKNRLIADWVLGHSHRINGNRDEALKLLSPLVDWCQRVNDVGFLGWTHKELGELSLSGADSTSALQHFTVAESKLKEAGMPEWSPDDYRKLVEQISALSHK
jgi:tetratricopeptide (TPR) repeat protein